MTTCLSAVLLRFREGLAAARAASPRRWLEGLLCACAASLPFDALSQVFAYCAALLALWMLVRRPGARPACPRWHWVAALVFALFCLGSLAWERRGRAGFRAFTGWPFCSSFPPCRWPSPAARCKPSRSDS
ncbi:MAG: hypothetical protein U1F77_06020 [Kiritimatiellia bacterium]